MFEAEFVQAGTFKKVIDVVKDLVDHGNFNCDDKGISLQGMDSSRVALVALYLESGGFSSYSCSRKMNLGCVVSQLNRLLRCADAADVLTLKAVPGADVLELVYVGGGGDKVSEFELKLVDIDVDQLGLPEAEFDVVVTMLSSEFQRICRDLSVIGDAVVIDVGAHSVKFSVSGDMGGGNVVLKPDDVNNNVVLEVSKAVELSFALRYLNIFAKAASLSKFCRLSLSPGLPMLVEFVLDGVGYLRFYLAPRIEEEEDDD
jgi:proliferating cell nuclear antigen